MFLICLILLNSKLFAVKSVEIKGNQEIPSEDIILNAGLNSARNIFQINNDELRSLILQDYRVASVKINRQLPGKIIISIQERIPICLLSYLNNLLIIGDDGLVMGIQEEVEVVELPVVTGGRFKTVQYGEKVTNSEFQSVLGILRYSDDYLHQVISEIDLNKFRLYLNLPGYHRSVKVDLGSGERLEEKITNLRSILLSDDFTGKIEQIDLRVADLPTVITSRSLKK
ncbi:MAG: FtsQ-type POTRA domain-containing protein [Firmicutes bacterium]|nr:FtsQ-type POTRA domain-containing protein [Bacillota bacterium]